MLRYSNIRQILQLEISFHVLSIWNNFVIFLQKFDKFSLRVTHQIHTGVSRPTAKGLGTGLPLMSAKILTIFVSVTRRRISSTLRHSTNFCEWWKHLSYITFSYCCHRLPWLSKWHKMLKLRVSIKRIDIYCPTLINKICNLCDTEIFFTAFDEVIKLHWNTGDDKLQACNAIDN